MVTPFPERDERIMNQIVTSSTNIGSSDPNLNGSPTRTGMIGAVLEAYNLHYDLVLTPDVVWLTCLQQFGAYINGGDRAETLRSKIVDFSGQKNLTVKANGNLFNAPYEYLTLAMAKEIEKNIKDPSIREWADPGFTTTTRRDEVCAAASLMSIMQKYFTYSMSLLCGIPTGETGVNSFTGFTIA